MANYLIIGASSGIGQALAQLLALEGHQVYGTYFKHAPDAGRVGISWQHLDVRNLVWEEGFLPQSLDGLVYCPGTIMLKPFARIAPADFQADYDLQVLGAIRVIQSCLPLLKQAPSPAIVLFSTVAVQTGFAFHSLVSASKGAVEGLARALAAEFAPLIRVNCIAPSLTDTPLAANLLNTEDKRKANAERNPLKRIGLPQDLAAAAAFLLSPAASWMSGQILHIDGGSSTLRV
jgi:NAD(P)-dependent dehydrogenase (short-subunit alcohol dehydrogenase family)